MQVSTAHMQVSTAHMQGFRMVLVSGLSSSILLHIIPHTYYFVEHFTVDSRFQVLHLYESICLMTSLFKLFME